MQHRNEDLVIRAPGLQNATSIGHSNSHKKRICKQRSIKCTPPSSSRCISLPSIETTYPMVSIATEVFIATEVSLATGWTVRTQLESHWQKTKTVELEQPNATASATASATATVTAGPGAPS